MPDTTFAANYDGNPDLTFPSEFYDALGIEIADAVQYEIRGETARLWHGDVSEPPVRVCAGEPLVVEFSDEQIRAARERLAGRETGRLAALDVLADVAGLDVSYRTADGTDAVDAVIDVDKPNHVVGDD